MRAYNLGFISDENIYNHVKETVLRYSANIDLKGFNKNIIDPVKLAFDAKVYGRTMEEIVASECIRQMDKSNNNHIGYFHQNLFRYAGNGWSVPTHGFDVVNEERHIFACLIENVDILPSKKRNALFIHCFDRLLKDNKAICYIVNLSDFSGTEKLWNVIDQNDAFSSNNMRLVSINRFYAIVFDVIDAYQKICNSLPTILEDIN